MSINTSEGLVKGHNNAQKFFATTCILPSGSSSDFKFSSGTTFPELEIIGSYTGSGIVFGKPSYNIRDYINTFVFNAQFGGGNDFSLAGMYAHFQFGGGNPMTLNMSSVDFGGATQKVLGLTGMKSGDVRPVNLFNAGATNQAALAFGRVNMQYHGNNQFSIVSDESSRFDFNPIIDPNASWGRNAGNILGTMINYNLFPGTPFSPLVPLIFGGPYDVNFRGTTYIPPK